MSYPPHITLCTKPPLWNPPLSGLLQKRLFWAVLTPGGKWSPTPCALKAPPFSLVFPLKKLKNSKKNANPPPRSIMTILCKTSRYAVGMLFFLWVFESTGGYFHLPPRNRDVFRWGFFESARVGLRLFFWWACGHKSTAKKFATGRIQLF